jgi:hypothetical protein
MAQATESHRRAEAAAAQIRRLAILQPRGDMEPLLGVGHTGMESGM